MKWLLGIFGGGPWLWIAAAALLASLVAWGGLGWYGKATAERELADYQLAAARVITARLEENQRLSDAQAKRSAEISDAYQKGKHDTAKAFQPALAALQALRARLGATDPGLRNPAPPDPGAVPLPADPALRPDATACTDQPGRIIAATDRVVADLAACANEKRQLISLQSWVTDVCAAH